jgi:hypothetical protein
MPKFMSTHQLPAGKFTRDQVCQLGQSAQQDAEVKPYRSFLNLSEGKAFCVIEAGSSDKVAAWFKKVGMPYESIVQVELEGEGGDVKDV